MCEALSMIRTQYSVQRIKFECSSLARADYCESRPDRK
jgi:hypothetical protein